MSRQPVTRSCRIEQELGRREVCPEAGCPFWDAGEEEREGHCAFERVDFNGRKAFVEWLHDLRGQLEPSPTDPLRQEFFHRMNEGRAD